jgi:hypothetical protein
LAGCTSFPIQDAPALDSTPEESTESARGQHTLRQTFVVVADVGIDGFLKGEVKAAFDDTSCHPSRRASDTGTGELPSFHSQTGGTGEGTSETSATHEQGDADGG